MGAAQPRNPVRRIAPPRESGPSPRARKAKVARARDPTVMEAAVIRRFGDPPVYGEFSEPPQTEGDLVVQVTAAALSRTVKSRATGTHYESPGALPFIPGIDGVGRAPDGTRVYFAFPTPPYGSMAQRTLVAPDHCIPLPEGLDDPTAAGIANPGISSWASFTERARLQKGETVLVNGATGVAGKLAVQIARHLGATKVIATGRNPDALQQLARSGADVTISLQQDEASLDAQLQQQFAAGVDVVLDYLWGPVAERVLIAAARAGRDEVPLRYIEIGSMAGSTISLPSPVLRSSSIVLMGSGTGGIPLSRLVAALAELFRAADTEGWKVESEQVPLAQVQDAWSRSDNGPRIILTMN